MCRDRYKITSKSVILLTKDREKLYFASEKTPQLIVFHISAKFVT